jgi:uncharacterized protein (TIGR02611 family)
MRLREQLDGFRQRVRSTRTGRLTLQLIVGILGGLVVAIGIVLIPFPGPGWLIVLAGLAILAVEFVWAQRLLLFTKGRLETWWHWLGRQSMLVRLGVGFFSLLFVAGVLLLSWSLTYGGMSFSDIWDFLRE